MGKVVPLTVQTAELKTATVEMTVIKVDGKQVTLAVFRQLWDEPLIADDGTLNGVPWGIVNYHPDRCSGDEQHWHIVWQRGNDLLRARVDRNFSFEVAAQCEDIDAHFYKKYIARGRRPNLTDDQYLRFEAKGEAQIVIWLENSRYTLQRELGALLRTADFFGEAKVAAREAEDDPEWVEFMFAELDKDHKKIKTWAETLRGLECLPKLYIAV